MRLMVLGALTETCSPMARKETRWMQCLMVARCFPDREASGVFTWLKLETS